MGIEVRTRLLSSSWKMSSRSCFAKVWLEIIEMFWTLEVSRRVQFYLDALCDFPTDSVREVMATMWKRRDNDDDDRECY